MNEWLNKTWVIRVISLLLAMITFIVITIDNQDTRTADIGSFDSIFSSSQEVQTLEDIPVSIQIDDEKYVVSGVPQTVKVTIQGTVSVVQSTATQRNFDVFVDLEGLEPGTHTVPIEYEGVSNRLSVEINPSEVQVLIEQRASDEYKVGVDFTNQDSIQPGFELLEATVLPDTVKITSSQNIVERIAIVTAFVDLEGLGEDMTFVDVPVRVYDHEGNQLNARIDPEVVSVEVKLVSPNKTVPVVVDTSSEIGDNYRITSMDVDIEEVEVFAAEEDLESINMIRTVPIDLSDLTGTTTIEVGLAMPGNIRLISHETVMITIEVEELTEAIIEDVEITVENLQDDLMSVFLNPDTGRMNLTIVGFPTDLTDIDSSDFQLHVDLAGLEDGEHQLPLEIRGPAGLEFSPDLNEITIEIQ